ncbi:uncharacterized protein LOC129286933 isoform X2 [Prosopis cineraria]|nr:uncharacterized protein LOC129286933 isoform X2 [Prosopis cineraria]XP_054779014.1 uncharacterized protein LOC129286933 isoform X2 [Prosopis cineraria]XP_054779015.1 uncharacterized protein LOC129286933 isoform X2 [Prosopis cineraria]XP_054779016.1 uncharacterized protein LOC129286933 isoform X2 [Prosopis cineraria]
MNNNEEGSSNNEKEHIAYDDVGSGGDGEDERREMDIKEEGSIYKKWSQIGDDVLGFILKHLGVIDYLQTLAVCSSWRSTVLKCIANKHCLPSPELPLLFLQTMEMENLHFFNLARGRVFNSIGLSHELFHHCYGTICGWMIMVEAFNNSFSNVKETDARIFFFNPITNAKIYMPSRLKVKSKIKVIVASTEPNDPNCVVVCLFYHHFVFAFSWISNDSWTIIEENVSTALAFLHIEIIDGKLYALTQAVLNSIVFYDLRKEPVKPEILARLPERRFAIIRRKTGPLDFIYDGDGRILNSWEAQGDILRTLVVDSSSGELLLIYLIYNSVFRFNGILNDTARKEYTSPPKIVDSKVFKLDMSKEPKWIEVKNLGNRMLFIGYWKSFVVSNDALQCPKEFIKENCIYFAYRFPCVKGITDEWKGLRIGRHRRIDKMVDYYTCERSSFTEVPYPVWFIPSLS